MLTSFLRSKRKKVYLYRAGRKLSDRRLDWLLTAFKQHPDFGDTHVSPAEFFGRTLPPKEKFLSHNEKKVLALGDDIVRRYGKEKSFWRFLVHKDIQAYLVRMEINGDHNITFKIAPFIGVDPEGWPIFLDPSIVQKN